MNRKPGSVTFLKTSGRHLSCCCPCGQHLRSLPAAERAVHMETYKIRFHGYAAV